MSRASESGFLTGKTSRAYSLFNLALQDLAIILFLYFFTDQSQILSPTFPEL